MYKTEADDEEMVKLCDGLLAWEGIVLPKASRVRALRKKYLHSGRNIFASGATASWRGGVADITAGATHEDDTFAPPYDKGVKVIRLLASKNASRTFADAVPRLRKGDAFELSTALDVVVAMHLLAMYETFDESVINVGLNAVDAYLRRRRERSRSLTVLPKESFSTTAASESGSEDEYD